MLSQKLSRFGFKMSDLTEFQQLKQSKSSEKAMDTTPESKSKDTTTTSSPLKHHPFPPETRRARTAVIVTIRASTPEEQS